ncbi:MAG TPA: alkaline phosphatase family protein [Sporichthyaceae bacterium]|nr:alkaline phosphatase family protein [Sporichthyaceae bacterium]
MTALCFRGIAATAVLSAVLAACGSGGSSAGGSSTGTPIATAVATAVATPVATPGRYSKVMLVMEENETYGKVLSGGAAPYLASLAQRFGVVQNLQAGYPVSCPSLPSYLILSSGSDHGVCDDAGPQAHQLGGDNLFAEVRASGRQWRVYAEAMPAVCDHSNSGNYLVRHTMAPYYTDLAGDCPNWDLPLGTAESGVFHDDVTGGQLPALSLVVPDDCDDMHGGSGCPTDLVRAGDDWLHRTLGAVTAGPDWTAGRLAILIAWDEGSDTDNHVPGLVLSPTTSQVTLTEPLTNCALLRLMSDVLTVAPLRCAQQAPAIRGELGL